MSPYRFRPEPAQQKASPMNRLIRALLAAAALGFGALALLAGPASAEDGPVLFPPPAAIEWVTDCGIVGVDPPSAVQVWITAYDQDGSKLGRVTVFFDPDKAGTHEAEIDASSLVAGHKGRVTAGYTLSGEQESESLPFDCLPPETTTTTTAPPPTTTAPPTTEPQEHPAPPPSIGTPTSIIPEAGPAPVTDTCQEGSGSDGCLAFTGPAPHAPAEIAAGGAAVLCGSAAAIGFGRGRKKARA